MYSKLKFIQYYQFHRKLTISVLLLYYSYNLSIVNTRIYFLDRRFLN